MNRMFRCVTVILIFVQSRSDGHELTRNSVGSPIRQYGSAKFFKKTTGFPKILNTRTSENFAQNHPYFVNPYINCDNLGQHSAGKTKSCVFATEKQIQAFESFTDFGGLGPLNSFEFDKFNTEGYIGDKEIHILHLPKNKPHDVNDIKLHLSLLHAHSTPDVPEIDLDLNKHFGNFEVNLASIQPPKLDSSFLPTPTRSGISDRRRPSLQYHLDSQFPSNADQFQHNGSEDILEIPHIENHPLEGDSSKSSYDTPGAVNSYGDPILPSAPTLFNSDSSFNPKLSDHVNHEYVPQYLDVTTRSYNSPDAVDSYGNLVKNPGQLGLNDNRFFKREDYFNKFNIINEAHRRRRQDPKILPGESKQASTGHVQMERETKHRNHKYK